MQNNPVEKEAELWVKIESDMHETVMEDDNDNDYNIEKEDFDHVLRKFKLKNKEAYYFLTKAGTRFQTSMFKLCRRLIQEEKFPEVFSERLLKRGNHEPPVTIIALN